MVIFGKGAGADVRALSLIHATRVAVLVTRAPVVLAFVLILAVLAAAFTEFVVLTGLARPLEGFLAFAPGGQAELTVMAIVVGADLGFVVLHHLTRIVVVIAGAPLVARIIGVKPAPRPAKSHR